ncbi:hypothetical protein A9K55_001517 [Cordyceps militaris]|uniref:Apple domain-containing protein n=1 Tax=Cordyceps militaris TaxID=73501 RepID=A0A2H4SRP8_CORMI|nr:hypothetical protein A9K55_001517 [Cordyceps militaris]
MKTSTFWTVAGLVGAAAAMPANSETPAAAVAADATSTGSAPSCTASLITTLCDYPSPGPYSAAIENKESCWRYCQEHGPCNFVIFAASGSPWGGGTCWTYPGLVFDASKGQPGSSCSFAYLSVFDKPTCTGVAPGPADRVPSECSAAVATPSARAAVCGYPTPPDDCRSSCTASGGVSDCIAQCALRAEEACTYAVFNPSDPAYLANSPGSCWMYPAGAYDAALGKTCSGDTPEQYVYDNPCPPRPSPTTGGAAAGSTA